MSATTSAIPTPDPNSRDWSIYLDNQSFNVTGLDGTPTTIAFADINAWLYEIAAQAATAGFALGFVSMLFIVLVLVTPAPKIRKPIFLLNLANLFLVAFREICLIIVQCASYLGVGQTFLGAFAQYPRTTWSPDIMSGILAVPIYACIMASLVLQVRVVFAAEPRTRFIFTLVGTLATLVMMGLILPWLIFSIEVVLRERDTLPMWLYTTFRIYFVAFVGVACLIFLYKLGFTIYRRRKMGMNVNRFGPLQIIFVMFCQCLVVPLIFYICDLTITSSNFNNFDSLGQVFLVCTLPLSSLWASAEVRDHGPVKQTLGSNGGSSGHHSRGKFVFWSRDRKSKDDISDVEKAPSYITDGTHTNEGVQLHPTSYDSTLEESDR